MFRHANAAGTSKHGGVLVIAGDDHAAKSSTLPHQTEHVFKSLMMPVLSPAGIQDYLEYGLHGFAMSRYSGLLGGLQGAYRHRRDIPPRSMSIRSVKTVIPHRLSRFRRRPQPALARSPLVQEKRLLHHKLYAALAYCRANNGLNRTIIDSADAKLGIITSGKSYLDVRQALDDLGIDDAMAASIGIRLYKVGMVWPLEAEGVRRSPMAWKRSW